MTPKEKANVLHTLMYGDLHNNMTWQEAKRCALIAVDEIINTSPMYCTDSEYESNLEYWIEVKKEIEKL